MPMHDTRRSRRVQAYMTALAGSLLSFLTLGGAVAFLDIATISYFDLPNMLLAAILVATVGPVLWFTLRLFVKALAFELHPPQGSSPPHDHGPAT